MLLYLIVNKTTKHFRQFSHVLLFCSCSDMIYLLCVFYCQERTWIIDTTHIRNMIIDPAMHLTHFGQCIIFTIRTSIMILTYIILPVQFHYRYWIIKHNRYSVRSLIIFYIAMAVCLGLVSGYISFQAYCTSDNNSIAVDFSKYWCVEIPMPQVTTAQTNTRVIVQRTFFSLALIISYAVVLWFAYFTYKELQLKAESMSSITLKLQNQFSRALFMQSIAPLILVVIPILLSVLESVKLVRIGHSGEIADLSVTFFPLLNSMCALVFISHYRRECIRILCPCFKNTLIAPHTSTQPDLDDLKSSIQKDLELAS
ncbi:hypothetical protein M3Y97_00996100 [Aphelenchoides bicaudatus]|nr:hypothetical protein M3Y97_00996100 [Aphelenchoides bicaudatus]